MKPTLLAIGLIAFTFVSCSKQEEPKKTVAPIQPTLTKPIMGEKVTPTIEGNLIKVNNRLCAVSRTPMDEKTLGMFTGQVAYKGTDPRFQGKIFEFNYCCEMCQNMFPQKFKKDPDSILRYHGLL